MDQVRGARLQVGARSVTGLRRVINQDSGYAGDHLLLVADGVGGAPAGDRASAVAVRTFATGLPDGGLAEAPLRERLARTNAALARAGQRDPAVRGMATTLTGLVLAPQGAFVAHIGDSRAYRLREGRIEQVTTDQSWVQMLVDTGMLDAAEAPRHPMRHLLMHSLSGSLADPEAVRLIPVDLLPGDRWLLATDGLTNYLPHRELVMLMSTTAQPQDLADALVDACLMRSSDNITAVVADVVTGVPSGGGTFIGAAVTPAAISSSRHAG